MHGDSSGDSSAGDLGGHAADKSNKPPRGNIGRGLQNKGQFEEVSPMVGPTVASKTGKADQSMRTRAFGDEGELGRKGVRGGGVSNASLREHVEPMCRSLS